jgi:membrane protein DedA with SNARE-associated domain
VGAKGGRPAIERYGRYLLLSKHELEIADRWFAKRGDFIIFAARLLPVIRTFIAFPAGVSRMNRTKFHIYTFVGSLPWCYALGYVGQRLGKELLDEKSPLKHFMHRFDAVIGAVIVLAATYFVWSRVKVLRQYKAESSAAAAKAD